MPEIQRRCEQVITSSALQGKGMLDRALSLTRGHRDSGAVPCVPSVSSFPPLRRAWQNRECHHADAPWHLSRGHVSTRGACWR